MDGSSERPAFEDAKGVVPEPTNRGARIGLVIALVVGIAFAGLLAVRVKQAISKREVVASERSATEARGQHKDPTVTAHPLPTKWVPRVDLTGTLKPWRDADVGFETPGRLVRVSVAVGDKVGAGQVLAVLDASRAAAQVGQAESHLATSDSAFRASVTRFYNRMRAALAAANLKDFGIAYDSLGALVAPKRK